MDKDELFKELKTNHPDWTDEQVWTNVSVMLSGEEAVTAAGPNVSPTEDLLRVVLEKAKEWLLETLPEIFLKVAEFFDDLISSLPNWAQKGLSYIFKMIVNHFAYDY